MKPFVRGLGWMILVVLSTFACSGSPGHGSAGNSADRLVEFVHTGDTTVLQGIFTDSMLQLMSIEHMLATREELLGQFGDLIDTQGPTFISDSSAEVILNYERMSLLASLEFTPQGSIRFLKVQPKPVDSAQSVLSSATLTDVEHLDVLQQAFDDDSQFVRLVTILSPT